MEVVTGLKKLLHTSTCYLQLESVMNSLFEAKCPTIFSGKGIAKHYESFESAGLFNGERVKDSEPFCGRYSLKNPDRIYQQKTDELGIMLSAYGTVKTLS
ncbi:hypothetical protein DPMN_079584 [Dreissena polymorpha]|uniref:Uncharacterized protein n=1 Tax=Dreissena polymorpha TaxID=45954 RepID=A0A9D3YSG1_DREPO|nr:hypothetical protein DPMN_079584 [Dreissena polymorpha]